MKSKLLYTLLFLGIIAGLTVSAILTHTLFDLSSSRPDTTESPSEYTKSVPAQKSPVTEITIGLEEDQPEKLSRTKPVQTDATPSEYPSDKKGPEATLSNAIGKIILINGNANAFGAVPRRPLKKESIILKNEIIETERDTQLTIRFNDGSMLSAEEMTTIVINEYIYAPDKKQDCLFLMQLLNGTCRIQTGAITDLNPNKFKVRTRLASIGIQGCELKFKSIPEKDYIYVLKLDKKERVIISTTANTIQMSNLLTGKEIPVSEHLKKNTIVIDEPNTLTILTKEEEFPSTSLPTTQIQPPFHKRNARISVDLTTPHPDPNIGPEGLIYATPQTPEQVITTPLPESTTPVVTPLLLPKPSVTLVFTPNTINLGATSTLTATPSGGSGAYTNFIYQYDNHYVYYPGWINSNIPNTNSYTLAWDHYIKYRVRVLDTAGIWSDWSNEAFLTVNNYTNALPPFQSVSGNL
ncbi:hypothetical protein ACFLS1_05055 [Verrucomicrobiota bacterium]